MVNAERFMWNKDQTNTAASQIKLSTLQGKELNLRFILANVLGLHGVPLFFCCFLNIRVKKKCTLFLTGCKNSVLLFIKTSNSRSEEVLKVSKIHKIFSKAQKIKRLGERHDIISVRNIDRFWKLSLRIESKRLNASVLRFTHRWHGEHKNRNRQASWNEFHVCFL